MRRSALGIVAIVLLVVMVRLEWMKTHPPWVGVWCWPASGQGILTLRSDGTGSIYSVAHGSDYVEFTYSVHIDQIEFSRPWSTMGGIPRSIRYFEVVDTPTDPHYPRRLNLFQEDDIASYQFIHYP